MRGMIVTAISKNLYKVLLTEKIRLINKEKKKIKRKHKQITMYDASESIYKKLTK